MTNPGSFRAHVRPDRSRSQGLATEAQGCARPGTEERRTIRRGAGATALAAALLLAACGAPAPSSGPVTLGGESVDRGVVDLYVEREAGRPAAEVPAARREELLRALARIVAAARRGTALNDAATEHALALHRYEVLAHRAAEQAGVFATPTEAEVADAYEAWRQSLPASELHVAHILVATEPLGDALILRLKRGEDFGRLARERSADTTADRDGDLGWIAAGKLPAPLIDAAASLKPGEIPAKPVHTIYGWHVLRLLGTRPAAVPPLDQVHAQLVVNLQQARYLAFLAKFAGEAGS
jgi:peptidyl-prolyl cis-trans isomerase C